MTGRKGTRGQGRKPKPAELKVLHGEKDKRRINKREPQVEKGLPVVPDHVAADELAAFAWDRICTTLASMKILSPAYAPLIEQYAVSYSNYRRAQAEVDKHGYVVTGANGGPVRNPACNDAHKYSDQCSRMLVEMGLTPSAKTRLVVEDVKENEHLKMFEQGLG